MAHDEIIGGCKTVIVAKDVCYVRFGGRDIAKSADLPYQTVRGEDLILDFDSEGRVIGIELIGPTKPCQQG